jgi:RNA polymerase sigma factor (TIGR02999 family)
MSDVTRILNAIEAGDGQAADKLLPLVYDELRRLAQAKMAHEQPGQTLDATALVHEVYLRLLGDQQFANRRHFFAAAAEAMRRILIENARRKGRVRHGGGRQRIELSDAQPARVDSPDELLAVDESLTQLAVEDPDAAQLVKLHYFAGLSVEESADALGMSRATAYRHWTFARAWLALRVHGDEH